MIRIASTELSATLNPLGAELWSLRDADGRELMTDADPTFWAGHAPLLFPIVGRLSGDVLRVDGRDYPMKQHGFARRMVFEVLAEQEDAVRFILHASEETRAQFPFAFALEVHYAIAGRTLDIAVEVTNPSPDVTLPFSFGFHPAFAWPLPYGAPRADHRITFSADEGDRIGLLRDGLLAQERRSPLDGRTLMLTDALFADDALIWPDVHSQSVHYGAAEGPGLRIDFADTPDLGIWTKAGAAFVCIEPWHGHADPAGYSGDFREKPGVINLPPAGRWQTAMQVTLTAGHG